jgi:hypothetical protein
MVTPQPDHFGGLALANDSGVWSWVKLSRFTRFQVIVDNQQDSTEMPEEIGAGDAEFLLREILCFAKNGLASRFGSRPPLQEAPGGRPDDFRRRAERNFIEYGVGKKRAC